jgi:hypothetical protein
MLTCPERENAELRGERRVSQSLGTGTIEAYELCGSPYMSKELASGTMSMERDIMGREDLVVNNGG